MVSKTIPIIGRYSNQPIPINNKDVDKANEKGSDVMPKTKTLLICGVSSTEISGGKNR